MQRARDRREGSATCTNMPWPTCFFFFLFFISAWFSFVRVVWLSITHPYHRRLDWCSLLASPSSRGGVGAWWFRRAKRQSPSFLRVSSAVLVLRGCSHVRRAPDPRLVFFLAGCLGSQVSCWMAERVWLGSFPVLRFAWWRCGCSFPTTLNDGLVSSLRSTEGVGFARGLVWVGLGEEVYVRPVPSSGAPCVPSPRRLCVCLCGFRRCLWWWIAPREHNHTGLSPLSSRLLSSPVGVPGVVGLGWVLLLVGRGGSHPIPSPPHKHPPKRGKE